MNEFLPNPIGDDSNDEWIELFNSSGENIVLDGWTIQDVFGSTKTFSLDNEMISADSFLLLYRSKTGISLNNDTEQIMLISPQGEHVLSGVYDTVKEGISYAYFESGWNESTPTPFAQNLAYASPTPLPTPTPTLSPTSTPTPSPTPLPSPTATPSAQLAVTLSEVYACAKDKEWIEFYNPNDHDISLTNWTIQDSTIQVKTLDNLWIPALGYGVKEWDGFFLNNDGDTVRLFFQGELKESFSYTTCLSTSSWIKSSQGVWKATTIITKGAINQVSDPQESDEDPQVEDMENAKEKTSQSFGEVLGAEITADESSSTTLLTTVQDIQSGYARFKLPLFLEYSFRANKKGEEVSEKISKKTPVENMDQTKKHGQIFMIFGGILLSFYGIKNILYVMKV